MQAGQDHVWQWTCPLPACCHLESLRHHGPVLKGGCALFTTGIAPYMAIELAAFDLLPQHMSSFARGFSAALIATTFCYPLDTLRWRDPSVSKLPNFWRPPMVSASAGV